MRGLAGLFVAEFCRALRGVSLVRYSLEMMDDNRCLCLAAAAAGFWCCGGGKAKGGGET